MGLGIGIITKNEQDNIRDCILSVKDIADEIVIVDDYSTDGTVEIAKELGAKVYLRRLDDFSSQRNYLLEKLTQDWVFILDADERVDRDLKEEIKKAILRKDIDGFYILRKNFIFGKYLKYGGNGRDWTLRLFRKDKARYFNLVHEVSKVKGIVSKINKGCILHSSISTLSDYVEKLNIYTTLESRAIKNRKRKLLIMDMLLRPLLNFGKRYFLNLGFLDGKEGFIFYSLSSYYTFAKYAKTFFKE